MKILLIRFSGCLILLWLAANLSAQCGPGGCFIPPVPPLDEALALEALPFSWVRPTDPADQHRVYLFRGPTQVGGWDYDAKLYRPYHARLGYWGLPRLQPPIAPPERAVPATPFIEKKADWQTNGVDASRRNGQEHEAYTLNGKAIDAPHAFAQLKLEDDSDKLWLVLIGSAESRDKVVADLDRDPKLADFRQRVRVWSVPADHFSLLDRDTNRPMYENSGNPSISLLLANGEELLQQNGYKPGDLEDIRKADPHYKKIDPPALPHRNGVPFWVVLLGGGVVTLLFLSKGQRQ